MNCFNKFSTFKTSLHVCGKASMLTVYSCFNIMLYLSCHSLFWVFESLFLSDLASFAIHKMSCRSIHLFLNLIKCSQHIIILAQSVFQLLLFIWGVESLFLHELGIFCNSQMNQGISSSFSKLNSILYNIGIALILKIWRKITLKILLAWYPLQSQVFNTLSTIP